MSYIFEKKIKEDNWSRALPWHAKKKDITMIVSGEIMRAQDLK